MKKPYVEIGEINGRDIKKLTKPDHDVVRYLNNSFQINDTFIDLVKKLRNEYILMQSNFIESQKQLISFQAEISNCKTEHLETLKNTVKTSVVDSVKTEFQTFSSTVKNAQPTEQVISSETLKSVVKRVVEEEDRSRNVVVFDLSEGSDSQLVDSVSEVFQNIGQKPKIVEACRIGRKS